MRILGLDPGTATTGYGIIDTVDGQMELVVYGVFSTTSEDDTPIRLQSIFTQLNGLLAEYRPDSAAVEQVFFGRNITTAIHVGQARGVLLLALANAGIPISEYSPPKVKESVTGYGKAAKNQVQMMVRHLLDLDETPQPDDAADALAVAITHSQYHRFHNLTGES